MALPSATLPLGKSISITAVPEDSSGNPGSLTVKPVWANHAGNPSTMPINPAGDGLSATLGPVSVPGTYQIDVTATGSGQFTSSFDLEVPENPATQIVFTFGTPA